MSTSIVWLDRKAIKSRYYLDSGHAERGNLSGSSSTAEPRSHGELTLSQMTRTPPSVPAAGCFLVIVTELPPLTLRFSTQWLPPCARRICQPPWVSCLGLHVLMRPPTLLLFSGHSRDPCTCTVSETANLVLLFHYRFSDWRDLHFVLFCFIYMGRYQEGSPSLWSKARS